MRGKGLGNVSLLDLSGADLDAEIQRVISNNPPKLRPFSLKEDEVMRKLYGKVTAKVIGKILNRSSSVVKKRAKTLGLKSHLQGH